jgi:hypothetical protein
MQFVRIVVTDRLCDARSAPQQRIFVMNETANEFDPIDEEILPVEVSDEELEQVAGPQRNSTMSGGSCWVPGGKIC